MKRLRFGPRVRTGLGLVLGIVLAVSVVSAVALGAPHPVPVQNGGENIVSTTNSTATTKVTSPGTSTVVVVIPSNATFATTNSSGVTKFAFNGTSIVVFVPNNSTFQPQPSARPALVSAMDVHGIVLGFLLVIVPGAVVSLSTRAWAAGRVAFLRQELEGSLEDGAGLDSGSSA